MQAVRSTASPRTGGLIVGVGLLVTVLFVGSIVALLGSGSSDASALPIAVVLVLISLPVFARRARLDGDRTLFWLLVLAVLLKLAMAVVRHYVVFDLYNGIADASGYDGHGSRIAANFRAGVFDTGLTDFSDTNFIRLLTGIVYTVSGSGTLGGFMVFSWIGFWGLYYFHRAFVLAVPEGRSRSYFYLLFFLPSLVFWPSSIGKEAWMMLGLGVGALGAAHVLSGRLRRGAPIVLLGLWMMAVVRPHVAALMAVALVAGYLVRPARRRAGGYALAGKVTGLVVLTVLTLFLVQRTDAFLRESGLGTQNVVAAIQGTFARTSEGGSQFQPSLVQSPTRAPIAVVTVLYRPLVVEAHNPQALAAALEGTFLLLLTVIRIPWILSGLRSVRRQPYVAFAIVFAGAFIVAFSGIANFGLLARQRVQLFPLFFVLLAVPPRRTGQESEPAEA
jgi:hypothetical protein